MREVLLVSRWFYPAGTSLLIWLVGCTLLALIALAASWTLRGASRTLFVAVTTVTSCMGAAACMGLIAAEIVVFELGSPLSIAAYALLAVFLAIIPRGRSARPRWIQCAAALTASSGAFAYLFFYGAIPPIIELTAQELEGVEGVNVLGNPSGVLQITEFADFECPPCAAQDQVMDRLWATYSDRIRYSFRHLPKRRHPNAARAALASQCAAQQGRFWETKRLLFANQDRLGELLARSELPTIPVGEAHKYAQCLQSLSAWPSVHSDLTWAQNLGLRATPSVIIGNKLIQGVVRYPRLAVIVRRELHDRGIAAPQRAATNKRGCGLAAQACSGE
jgi:protein-disulfide isomerase